MATKKKTTPKKRAPAKKKPPFQIVLTTADDGTFSAVVQDEDGKELEVLAAGSRNVAYPRRVASQQYPDLPLS